MNALKEETYTDTYKGLCSCCGKTGLFQRSHRSIREGYPCRSCKASLRYRGQAEAILKYAMPIEAASIAELSQNSTFRSTSIFEPGVGGAFRATLGKMPDYMQSFYWSDVTPGDTRDGVRCENLEQITLDDCTFDLVITSDILEHVRRPIDAFREIHRVLRRGGAHIFSIPVQRPMPLTTFKRVDTDTSEDVLLVKAHYHGNGIGGRSLVYNDFGYDLVEQLLQLGFLTELATPIHCSLEASDLITFTSWKL